ncbi:MAG: M23 family metallopeptidase [Burkholderiaceae bacterium]|nr:M23 family metallopeptidase [Burkholderiaceae bacterium]
MQILITDSTLVRTRALTIKRWQFALGGALLAALLMMVSGAIYHFIFLTAAREGWPLMGQLVKLIVREESAQRERFMRENLDAIALRVGEMQAKVVKLEALSERVTGMAGVKTDDLRALPSRSKGGGQGGPFVPLSQPSLEQLNEAIDQLDERAGIGGDLFTLVESRLFEAKLLANLVPSTHPVAGPVGSGFGFRIDPITGRAALHTGLDFPSDVGTPILAAAGGIVIVSENHPAYGQMIEVDHGNALVTRYAHASKLLVKTGTLVKRGQKIAEVGNSGRSTGPHLHFEVMLSGVQQNPTRFLNGQVTTPAVVADGAKWRAARRRAAAAAAETVTAATPTPAVALSPAADSTNARPVPAADPAPPRAAPAAPAAEPDGAMPTP